MSDLFGRHQKADEQTSEVFNVEISEIERLVRDFKEKFAAGTENADEFLTISQIELLWGELQSRTNNIYSDMVKKLGGVLKSMMALKRNRN